MDRRAFLQASLGASLALGCGSSSENAGEGEGENAIPPGRPGSPFTPGDLEAPTPPADDAPMPMRKLGKTGLEVSLLGFGTWFGAVQYGTRDEALAVLGRAMDLGVNFIDTSPVYAPSEERVGEALVGRRDKVILASKTEQRSCDGAWRELETSLRLLRTDHLDLYQVHTIRTQAEIDAVFATGGALEAFIEAREQKIVRHIGVTGHANADLLLQMIERFDFDTLLTALNAADWQRRPALTKLVPKAVEKGMGLIGMKALGGPDAPMLNAVNVATALRYAWSLPVSCTVVGMHSLEEVAQDISLVKAFRPFDADGMLQVERMLTVEQAAHACWYKDL